MFTYVKLKNYKSLVDLTVDLCTKNNIPKNFICIYGANGSGKTNFSSVFKTLSDTLKTLQIRDIRERILSEREMGKNIDNNYLRFIYNDISNIIAENKTINSTENMILEFGFLIDEKPGCYQIEFDNERIVHEKLEYTLAKNRGCYFELSDSEIKINNFIFINSNYKKDFLENIKKFWGKHSVLSILLYDMEDKADGYLKDQLHQNLFNVLRFFNNISCRIIGQSYSLNQISSSYLSNINFDEGRIPLAEEPMLDQIRNYIHWFFTNTYKDIVGVYYKKNINENFIDYKLILQKKIYGTTTDVNFELESYGTKSLLDLLPFFIAAMQKGTVVIDEIDNAIHDILLFNLLRPLCSEMVGQLIITTHNIALLDLDVPKDSFYFVDISDDGTKTFNCATDFNRIQAENSIRSLYLRNKFHGLPWEKIDINYSDGLQILSQKQ